MGVHLPPLIGPLRSQKSDICAPRHHTWGWQWQPRRRSTEVLCSFWAGKMPYMYPGVISELGVVRGDDRRSQEPRVVAQRGLEAPSTSLSGPSAQKTRIFGQIKVSQGQGGPYLCRSWSSRAIRGQYLCKYDQEIEISTPRTLFH